MVHTLPFYSIALDNNMKTTNPKQNTKKIESMRIAVLSSAAHVVPNAESRAQISEFSLQKKPLEVISTLTCTLTLNPVDKFNVVYNVQSSDTREDDLVPNTRSETLCCCICQYCHRSCERWRVNAVTGLTTEVYRNSCSGFSNGIAWDGEVEHTDEMLFHLTIHIASGDYVHFHMWTLSR